MLNTAVFAMRSSPWSLNLLRRVWGEEDGRESPFVNHTWWEQAAFAWHLLGNNTFRFRDVDYQAWAESSSVAAHEAIYPPEVRLMPQASINSYHAISSRVAGDAWTEGDFVLSFNGVQSLSSSTIVRTLHATYYEKFCRLNRVEDECVDIGDDLLMPWLKVTG